jgi:hypothetical protein
MTWILSINLDTNDIHIKARNTNIQIIEFDHLWNFGIVQAKQNKMKCRATQTPDKWKGRIKCLGGVSISYWPATPAVGPILK